MLSLRHRPSRHETPIRVLIVAALAAVLFGGTAALAASALQDAKAAGEIGEKRDGYVGLTGRNPTAELKTLVGEVNTKRKEQYKKVAKKTGARLREVTALAGERLIEEAAAGSYVEGPDGEWMKKP